MCKVDPPNSKPMPRVLISIGQEGKKSPATVKKSMHFPFHMTQRENVILVNYLLLWRTCGEIIWNPKIAA